MTTIQIRVTEDFKEITSSLARQNNQNITEYIKHLILNEHKKELKNKNGIYNSNK